jgi:ubiquinone biosynthesis monooxygenase Coq7
MLNLDQLIIEGDRALRILTGVISSNRSVPQPLENEQIQTIELSETENMHEPD